MGKSPSLFLLNFIDCSEYKKQQIGTIYNLFHKDQMRIGNLNSWIFVCLLFFTFATISEATILKLLGGLSKIGKKDKDSSDSNNNKDSSSDSKAPTPKPTPVVKPLPAPIIIQQPHPVVVVNPRPLPVPSIVGGTGSYVVINDYNSDSNARLCLNFLRNKFSNFGSASILRFERQVVSGYNYKILLQYSYGLNTKLQYSLLVSQSLANVFQIVSSNYVNIPVFSSVKLRAEPFTRNPFFRDIDTIVRPKITNWGTIYDVLESQIAEPYYSLTYKCDCGRRVQVSLIHDWLWGGVRVLNTNELSPLNDPSIPCSSRGNLKGGILGGVLGGVLGLGH